MAPAAGVCTNCGQWVWAPGFDCVNRCASRGFAEFQIPGGPIRCGTFQPDQEQRPMDTIKDPDEYVALALRTEHSPDFIRDGHGATIYDGTPDEIAAGTAPLWTTAAYTHTTSRLLHGVIGLASEIGEKFSPIKKALIYGKPLSRKNMLEELGDFMWYAAIVVSSLGSTFGEVWARNITKLRERYPGKFDAARAIAPDHAAEQRAADASTRSRQAQKVDNFTTAYTDYAALETRVLARQFFEAGHARAMFEERGGTTQPTFDELWGGELAESDAKSRAANRPATPHVHRFVNDVCACGERE